MTGDLVDRYLDESVKDFRVPRFLLNDVVRYWRTICAGQAGIRDDFAPPQSGAAVARIAKEHGDFAFCLSVFLGG
ncbi:MAG: hypothetical protein ACRDLA_14095 [Thermoleophilaceae bacterium]